MQFIVFPFSVEDNSKEGNDGKSTVKNTNSFVHTEKSNGNGSKTNCSEGGSAEQNNKDCPNSNYCDRLEASDEIKVEIKTDPDAPPSLSSNVQPAFGSELLPLHANSKHPVSTINLLNSIHEKAAHFFLNIFIYLDFN